MDYRTYFFLYLLILRRVNSLQEELPLKILQNSIVNSRYEQGVYQTMKPFIGSSSNRYFRKSSTEEDNDIDLSPCGRNFSEVNGIFTTPEWPSYYPHNIKECSFTIQLPNKDYNARITCDKFHLQPRANGICKDYLSINGNQFCGTEKVDLTVSAPVHVSFASDGLFRYPGGNCIYRSIRKDGIALLNGFDKNVESSESNTRQDRGRVKQFFHGSCEKASEEDGNKRTNGDENDQRESQIIEEGLWSGKCGDSPIPLENRIIGGYETKIHQYPWMVSIFKPCEGSGGDDEFCHVCGGTVISDSWILTAAHCVDKLHTYNISIILGDHNLKSISRDQRSAEVDRVVIHPDYNKPTFLNNDIGLVHTKKPIPFSNYVSPLCLPGLGETGFGTSVSHNTSTLDTTGLMVVGKNATIIGWGVVSDDGEFPNGLNEVIVEVMDNKLCRGIYGPGFTENMMCTSGKNAKGDCYGDSGGPALVKNEEGAYIQVGVLSFGAFDGCELGYPSGQVFVFKFIDWIQHITGLQFGSQK